MIIGLLILERKLLKGFYHIWVWRPSWSCDLNHLKKLSSPLPKEALIGPAVSEEKMFEIDGGFDWPRGFRGDV